MADSVTSVLLVDYDSVRRSLAAIDAAAGERFAPAAAEWLEALETGDVLQPSGARRILVRRCFADPDLLAEGSRDLAAAGFEIVKCPAQGSRSDTRLHFAIEAIDALNDKTRYDEFILLSGDGDLAPLLARLKADDRRTVIYADDANAGDNHLADAVLSADALATLVAGNVEGFGKAPDREEIEAFARRISGATSIPMLSPRTYAQLFAHLSEEIAAHGYGFQTTARNVADRLSAAGRNVARRQVVFVVKGLALKGHVFSTDDTPRHLADVFREQARYLIGNAGIALDAQDERLLFAWIAGRSPDRTKTGGKKAAPKTKSASGPSSGGSTPRRKASEKQPAKRPAPAAEDDAGDDAWLDDGEEETAPETATAEDAPPATAEDDVAAERAAEKAARHIRTAEEVKTEIAAKIATSVRERKAAAAKPPPEDTQGDQRSSGKSSRRKRKGKGRTQQAPEQRTTAGGDPLESSILAAIAEAVDVLVETSGESADATEAGGTGRRRAPEPAPEAPEDDAGEGDDIGDEIQRIIASYDRHRRSGQKD